jgi:hypothetical protein
MVGTGVTDGAGDVVGVLVNAMSLQQSKKTSSTVCLKNKKSNKKLIA